jgi:hypothetical protein
MAFFPGLLEHAAVQRQLGDEELEAVDLGLEFGYAQLFLRDGVPLEGLPSIVGGRSDAGLAARLVDAQPGVEVGLEVAEDRGDAVRSRWISHGSLPGSLPVVRLPLRLDQLWGGRPAFLCQANQDRCSPSGSAATHPPSPHLTKLMSARVSSADSTRIDGWEYRVMLPTVWGFPKRARKTSVE